MLSGRVACRTNAGTQTRILTVRRLTLSAATRRTSKKPHLCGPLPVAKLLADNPL